MKIASLPLLRRRDFIGVIAGTASARAREGVTRNVGLQTIKAAIEKAVMQRGSYARGSD
jgi:hypothetical protein